MKLSLIVFVLCMFLPFATIAAEANSNLLVVARPLKSKFIVAEGELPENRNSDAIFMGAVYLTELKILQVISGSTKERIITADLIATNRGYLSKDRILVVLFVRDEQGQWTAVHWHVLQKFACMPTDMISKYDLASDFEDGKMLDDEKCLEIGDSSLK